jgi:hypothetical protein
MMLMIIISGHVEEDVCLLSRAVDVDNTGFLGALFFKYVPRKMSTALCATT